MREQDVFIDADRAFAAVTRDVADDQWALPLVPADGDTPAKSVRDMVNAVAYDDAWLPAMLSGATMAEVGDDPWTGDLLGERPAEVVAEFIGLATAAAEGLSDDDLDRTVHCSFGDYPAREYLWQITSFRTLMAWDVAQAVGVADPLPAPLVEAVLAQLEPVADEWRQWGVFPPRVEVPADASALDRLLGLTGRTPAGQ